MTSLKRPEHLSSDASVPKFKNFRISYHNSGDDTQGNTEFLNRIVAVFSEYHLDIKQDKYTMDPR